MLNLTLISDRLTALGWGPPQLAEACQVSREAVSNWLSGESLPRPRKLRQIAEALAVAPNDLLVSSSRQPEPIVAYRTKRNAPASPEALETAADVARHLRELVPYISRDNLFAPGVLETPQLSDDYISKAARQARARAGLSTTEPIRHAHLISMHQDFGSILVPVLWGEEKSGHENALSVYLPESKSSWVIFNLNARIDDFNYWMAHELAHCYTLSVLQGDLGETFAERFAQELLFPEEVAAAALDDIMASDHAMNRVAFHAKAHDISTVTVAKQIDRISVQRTGQPTGLIDDQFWNDWNMSRNQQPTVAYALFGIDSMTSSQYIDASERIFGTPIFRALGRWQEANGGASPSFVATALNIQLGDALFISKALSTLPIITATSVPVR
jgi:transcriptional regulator with XRE-family HTH domain